MTKDRQHWVSSSYLKQWTSNESDRSQFVVRFLGQSKYVMAKPVNIGREDRLYDLDKIELAKKIGKDFLDKHLLQKILEPALANLIRNFKPRSFSPSDHDLESLVWLAIQIWGRNPIAIELTKALIQKNKTSQFSNDLLTCSGNLALTSMLVLASQIKHGVGGNLYYHPRHPVFVTTDNPAACWAILEHGMRPVFTNEDLVGSTGTCWLFPINPWCLLEFWIRGDGKMNFVHRKPDDRTVRRLNNMIRRSASLFVVEGYWRKNLTNIGH